MHCILIYWIITLHFQAFTFSGSESGDKRQASEDYRHPHVPVHRNTRLSPSDGKIRGVFEHGNSAFRQFSKTDTRDRASNSDSYTLTKTSSKLYSTGNISSSRNNKAGFETTSLESQSSAKNVGAKNVSTADNDVTRQQLTARTDYTRVRNVNSFSSLLLGRLLHILNSNHNGNKRQKVEMSKNPAPIIGNNNDSTSLPIITFLNNKRKIESKKYPNRNRAYGNLLNNRTNFSDSAYAKQNASSSLPSFLSVKSVKIQTFSKPEELTLVLQPHSGARDENYAGAPRSTYTDRNTDTPVSRPAASKQGRTDLSSTLSSTPHRRRRAVDNSFTGVLGLDPGLDDIIDDFIGLDPAMRSRDRRNIMYSDPMAAREGKYMLKEIAEDSLVDTPRTVQVIDRVTSPQNHVKKRMQRIPVLDSSFVDSEALKSTENADLSHLPHMNRLPKSITTVNLNDLFTSGSTDNKPQNDKLRSIQSSANGHETRSMHTDSKTTASNTVVFNENIGIVRTKKDPSHGRSVQTGRSDPWTKLVDSWTKRIESSLTDRTESDDKHSDRWTSRMDHSTERFGSRIKRTASTSKKTDSTATSFGSSSRIKRKRPVIKRLRSIRSKTTDTDKIPKRKQRRPNSQTESERASLKTSEVRGPAADMADLRQSVQQHRPIRHGHNKPFTAVHDKPKRERRRSRPHDMTVDESVALQTLGKPTVDAEDEEITESSDTDMGGKFLDNIFDDMTIQTEELNMDDRTPDDFVIRKKRMKQRRSRHKRTVLGDLQELPPTPISDNAKEERESNTTTELPLLPQNTTASNQRTSQNESDTYKDEDDDHHHDFVDDNYIDDNYQNRLKRSDSEDENDDDDGAKSVKPTVYDAVPTKKELVKLDKTLGNFVDAVADTRDNTMNYTGKSKAEGLRVKRNASDDDNDDDSNDDDYDGDNDDDHVDDDTDDDGDDVPEPVKQKVYEIIPTRAQMNQIQKATGRILEAVYFKKVNGLLEAEEDFTDQDQEDKLYKDYYDSLFPDYSESFADVGTSNSLLYPRGVSVEKQPMETNGEGDRADRLLTSSHEAVKAIINTLLLGLPYQKFAEDAKEEDAAGETKELWRTDAKAWPPAKAAQPTAQLQGGSRKAEAAQKEGASKQELILLEEGTSDEGPSSFSVVFSDTEEARDSKNSANQGITAEPETSSKDQDTLWGSSKAQDTLSGSSLDQDTLSDSSQAHDTLSGSSQDQDTLWGSSKTHETLSGSSQDHDTFWGSSKAHETLSGSSQNHDTLWGSSKAQDTLSGSSQDQDTLWGSSKAQDTLWGSSLSQGTLLGSSHDQDTFSDSSQAQDKLWGSQQAQDKLTASLDDQATFRASSHSNGHLLTSSKTLRKPTASRQDNVPMSAYIPDYVDDQLTKGISETGKESVANALNRIEMEENQEKDMDEVD